MITLTLLHPIQSIPVQSWNFEQESVIRIGRATDNHVILYSAVVSRHHVELRLVDSKWEIVNLGANGTYLDGKRITQVPVVDGVIIRLARSGPNIQIHVGQSAAGASQAFMGEKTLAQRIATRSDPTAGQANGKTVAPNGSGVPAVPPTQQPISTEAKEPSQDETVGSVAQPRTAVDAEGNPIKPPPAPDKTARPITSQPASENLFCQDSGQPLQVLQTLVEYKVIKTLYQDQVSLTQVAWRNGQSLLLKTLNPEWVNHQESLTLFEQEAKTLQQLSHPGIPRFVDYFRVEDRPYLAMEWVHGQSLQHWVAEKGPLTVEEAIAVILQICDVLDYLHQQVPPYLHQDINPANLIWRSSSFASHTVSLVGIPSLKLLEPDAASSVLVYRAPEQQQGHPVLSSDLYALGPTLIYLVTGKSPAEFYAHREQGYRLYPEYVPGLEANLVEIVRKLTNLQPEDRYASARELAEVLGGMSWGQEG